MARVGALGAAVVVAIVAAMLGFAAPGDGAGPPAKLFVPGHALAGVRLGMTPADVTAAWGKEHGVCRGCERTTWYFNERPFEPQGAAVAFERGRVVHAYTVWQPVGWRTREGVSLGDQDGRVHDLFGPLRERSCDGYAALLLGGQGPTSVFYVYRDGVWGFGLLASGVDPCV